MSRCDVSFQRCLDIDCDINRLCVCWVHSSWLCSHEISSSDDLSLETFAQLAASTLTELPVSSPVWQILVYQILYVSFWYVFSDNKEGDYISLHLEGSQKLLESQSLDIAAEVCRKSLRNEHSGSHVHCAHYAEILFTLRHQCRKFATSFCFASDNIRHPALLFPSGMSFLTTKEVMTFCGSLHFAQQVRQSMKE